MNKVGYLWLLMFPIACTGQHYSDAVIASVDEVRTVPRLTDADTIYIHSECSEIAWKGTKLWGRGMHTGIVPVKEGYLLFSNDRLSGGIITADMTSIGITDIPPDQPEPIRILTGHLEDPLFFDVAEYPEARFSFTHIEQAADRELLISGNLTIKDVTKNITVPAIVDSTGPLFNSTFRINRFDWNIAYRGGFGATRFAARNFVDRYIELDITINLSSGKNFNALAPAAYLQGRCRANNFKN